MGLIAKAGQLVKYAGQLANSCACCIRYWCVPSYTDACGQQRYTCMSSQTPPAGAQGPYASAQCEGNACAPTNLCLKFWCFITGYTPCGTTKYQCRQSATGEGAVLGPYDSSCPNCTTNYTCPATNYYCCWDKNPVHSPGTGESAAQKSCQLGPCTGMSTGDYALYDSGPHGSRELCREQCSAYDCSGSRKCSPSATGQYKSLSECTAACGCNSEAGGYPCNGNITPQFSTTSTIFTIRQPTVRDTPPVAFHSFQISVPSSQFLAIIGLTSGAAPGYTRGGPVRWQVFAPGFDGAGNQVASRVMKVDSDWRGQCPPPAGGACPASDPVYCNYPCDAPADCEDVDHNLTVGQVVRIDNMSQYNSIRFCKREGLTCFEVVVMAPCPSTDWQLSINCDPARSCTEPVPNPPDGNPAP